MRDRGSPFPPRGGREPPGLSPGYLRGGYFQQDGKSVRREVIEEWAKEVAQKLSRHKGGRGYIPVMAPGQLRRFYTRALYLQRISEKRPFESLMSELDKFKPLAAYAVSKGVAPREFEEFMSRNMNLAVADDTGKSFKEGFMEHFQCVVAYHYYFVKQKGGKAW